MFFTRSFIQRFQHSHRLQFFLSTLLYLCLKIKANHQVLKYWLWVCYHWYSFYILPLSITTIMTKRNKNIMVKSKKYWFVKLKIQKGLQEDNRTTFWFLREKCLALSMMAFSFTITTRIHFIFPFKLNHVFYNPRGFCGNHYHLRRKL